MNENRSIHRVPFTPSNDGDEIDIEKACPCIGSVALMDREHVFGMAYAIVNLAART